VHFCNNYRKINITVIIILTMVHLGHKTIPLRKIKLSENSCLFIYHVSFRLNYTYRQLYSI